MAHDHSHGHGHSCQHSHRHGHDHRHDAESPPPPPPKSDAAATDEEHRREVLRKLKTASLLCLAFFVVEVVGGLLAGSLAVLSDAAHLSADLAAFVVAIGGSHVASLPATDCHTFGLKRIESLAALFSAGSLAALSVGLALVALRRIWVLCYDPEEAEQVDGKLMSTIAFIGVIVNVVLAYVLGEDHIHMVGSEGCDHGHDHGHGHSHGHDNHEGHSHSHNDHDEESDSLLSGESKANYSAEAGKKDDTPCKSKERNVNLHAAYLHVLADLLQSVVVLVAGLIIWHKPAWQLADPICTLVFSTLVCYTIVGVIRSSLSVLLEAVPPGVDWADVHAAISNVRGVSNVHDLHIWSISQGNFILSVHATAEDAERAYRDIKAVCNKRDISHLTVQLQPSTMNGCATCDEGSGHQCR